MAEITVDLVKELREKTGAGMMDCKRALTESKGDIDAAIEAMRKSGHLKAAKKADRITAEGIIVTRISQDGKQGVAIEVNSETDFVARDSNFVAFANAIAEVALLGNATDVIALNTLKLPSGHTVEEERQALITKVGENVQIRRLATLTSQHQVASYVHSGRIGVLVAMHGGNEELNKDIAMHIVASNPLVVRPEDVPQELIAKEKEIFSAQAAGSGKPADIIAKMVDGRIKKFVDEISLLGQPFVKNPDQSVAKVLGNAQVEKFIRFAAGEGIEKKADNFVEEVMAQVQGS